jgi:hypothetical protein
VSTDIVVVELPDPVSVWVALSVPVPVLPEPGPPLVGCTVVVVGTSPLLEPGTEVIPARCCSRAPATAPAGHRQQRRETSQEGHHSGDKSGLADHASDSITRSKDQTPPCRSELHARTRNPGLAYTPVQLNRVPFSTMTTPEPRIDGREERGDRTAQALLTAGRNAFAKVGYAAASVRDIARAAGVNPALVRYHFGIQRGPVSPGHRRGDGGPQDPPLLGLRPGRHPARAHPSRHRCLPRAPRAGARLPAPDPARLAQQRPAPAPRRQRIPPPAGRHPAPLRRPTQLSLRSATSRRSSSPCSGRSSPRSSTSRCSPTCSAATCCRPPPSSAAADTSRPSSN